MNNIRLAKETDVAILKSIIDESISQDFYSEDFIREYILAKNSFVYVYVAEDDSPMGCLFCEIGPLADICRKDNIPYPDEPFSGYNDDTKVIIYKTAATLKKSRNQGILYDFLNEAEKYSKNIEHDLKICLCCVIPGEIIPVKKHVESNGFISKKRYKSPWNHIKSYCSCCNNEYCKCDGILYVKENKGE